VIAAIFVPFTDLWLAWDFPSHRDEREIVTHAIFEGRIVPNYSHNPKLIALPGEHRDTSRGGGDVVLDYYSGSRSVYFFTFRGILGSSSGYLFVERDAPPSGGYIVYDGRSRRTGIGFGQIDLGTNILVLSSLDLAESLRPPRLRRLRCISPRPPVPASVLLLNHAAEAPIPYFLQADFHETRLAPSAFRPFLPALV
jgi:hypothetical protein